MSLSNKSARTQRKPFTRSGTRRGGDDYQDIVALEKAVEWLKHPDRFTSLWLEADDAGCLDDVVVETADGSLLAQQVKFSAYPEDEGDAWDLDDLLTEKESPPKKNGTRSKRPCLLAKLLLSLERLAARGVSVEGSVVSNRRPTGQLVAALSGDGFLDIDRIVDSPQRDRLVEMAGGEERAKRLLFLLRFDLDRSGLSDLERAVKRRFFRLGGDEHGWLSLKDELRSWVKYKDQPGPDGVVRLSHVRKAALWYSLQALPQRFTIPDDYVLPSAEFHEDMAEKLRTGSADCLVLTGSPGVGKSTYCSYLFEELQSAGEPVVRHHYFLSLDDRTHYRLDHERAAKSLMHDLERDHHEALGGQASRNPRVDDLRSWVEACGQYYLSKERRLIIFIDGLDHVWRERRSVKELEKLLRQLLPPPPGVRVLLATQPIADDLLPPALLRAAPRGAWLELPLLNELAVRRWLEFREAELTPHGEDKLPGHLLDRFAAAFFTKSGGHPLHLRYSLKALLDQGIAVTESAVGQLPECPHSDITEYYRDLLGALPSASKMVVYLLVASGFPWPSRKGLIDCLSGLGHSRADSDEALRLVEHLLVTDDLGLRPFHSSVLVFVPGLPDYETHREALQAATLRWLRESAPNHWNWSHEWMLEADLGNDRPLVEGPDHQWAVAAISQRRDPNDVKDILSRCGCCAFTSADLRRSIKVGLIRDYYGIAFDYYREIPEMLLFAQLVLDEDTDLCRRLLAGLQGLTDQEISFLAEAAARDGSQRNVSRCFNELRERNNAGLSRAAQGEYVSDEDRLFPLLRVAATATKVEPDGDYLSRLLDFAVRNRNSGLSTTILRQFLDGLSSAGDTRAIRKLLSLRLESDTLESSADGSDTERLRESEAKPAELDSALSFLLRKDELSLVVERGVLMALEEDLDLGELAARNEMKDDPFFAIYAAITKSEGPDLLPIALPDQAFPELQGYEDHRSRSKVSSLFNDLFFRLLANHLQLAADRNTEWLADVSQEDWPGRCVHHFNEIAAELAESLRGRDPQPFGWFYRRLQELELPEKDPSGSDYNYGSAARSAAVTLGFKIWCFGLAWADAPGISKDDLESAFSSGYCDPERWLTLYVERRKRYLTDAALEWLLTSQQAHLDDSMEEFHRRSERYALLASLACLHGRLEEARSLVDKSAENLLTHSHHKDMLLYQTLEVFRLMHHTGSPEGLAKQQEQAVAFTRTAILEIAPIVARVTDFTDGDETNHLPCELADVLGETAPDLLLPYYRWLVQRQEFVNALHAFAEFIRVVDLEDPLNLAIAKTTVHSVGLAALEKRAEAGDDSANEAVTGLQAYFGPRPNPPDLERVSASAGTEPVTPERMPPPGEYEPSRLSEFIDALRSAHVYPRDERIRQWATHWAAEGESAQVFEALTSEYQRGKLWGCEDLMAERAQSLYGASEAYPWLVKAQSEDWGWHRYFTAKDRAERRWRIIKSTYPDKWFDFLKQSITRASPSVEWRGFVVSSQVWVRMVEYLLLFGHRPLARQVSEEVLQSTLEMVSPIRFPVPEWVHKAREASSERESGQ